MFFDAHTGAEERKTYQKGRNISLTLFLHSYEVGEASGCRSAEVINSAAGMSLKTQT